MILLGVLLLIGLIALPFTLVGWILKGILILAVITCFFF